MKKKVQTGAFQLVFFTPELLIENNRWRKVLMSDVYATRLKAFVVDEAHTVSKWYVTLLTLSYMSPHSQLYARLRRLFYNHETLFLHRGKTFHVALDRIGEVRSILPPGVCVMALTATATRTLRYAVSATIGMRNPFIVAIPPCKRNMMYSVSTLVSVEETLKPVVDRLRKERTAMPRMIIYGRSFGMCADVYLFFRSQLGEQFTEPTDAPDVAEFRLVDMFTSVTDPPHKDHIIRTFAKNSCLRIVIATIAFGMGLDCPDIRQVVHVDLPDDIESYIHPAYWTGR